MEEEYNEEFGNNVPDLNVEENKEEETPSVEESLISILEKKMIEIEYNSNLDNSHILISILFRQVYRWDEISFRQNISLNKNYLDKI